MASDALLDTNVVSELGRRKNPLLVRRAEEHLERSGHLTTSAVTVFEVVRGFLSKGRAAESSHFLTWMQRWEVMPFDTEAAEIAGRVQVELLRNGTPIELGDVLIASIAIAQQRTLVTGNLRHFEPIAALGFVLPLEDWSR